MPLTFVHVFADHVFSSADVPRFILLLCLSKNLSVALGQISCGQSLLVLLHLRKPPFLLRPGRLFPADRGFWVDGSFSSEHF